MLTEIKTSEHVFTQPHHELVQASSGKRLANYLIDLIFFYMIIFFWSAIGAIISPSTFDAINDNDSVFGSFYDRIIGLIAYAVIMGAIETMFRGKSIGKLITGTKAVNEDGSDISAGTAFTRGFSRAVPFEAFSALGNPPYPWHDKWSRTYVIDEKETTRYNNELRNN